MDAQTLVAAAARQTGLDDLGDTSILVGLHKLIDALDTEANLSENGRKRFETNIVNTLANRLRVEDYLRKHPDLLQRPVDRPMFVFGLPRTGTTLAINLPGRWTLKNPWHALFLDDLTEVYPDAQFVMTHRDPVEVVGSACSLIKHVRLMFSDSVDTLSIGESMVDIFDRMIERGISRSPESVTTVTRTRARGTRSSSVVPGDNQRANCPTNSTNPCTNFVTRSRITGSIRLPEESNTLPASLT